MLSYCRSCFLIIFLCLLISKYFNLQNPMILVIISYLFLIFHDVSVAATDDFSLPYTPRDNITLDCGSSTSNFDRGSRLWEGDFNSKFFPTQSKNNESNVSPANEPYSIDVPYQTARLSRSEFTYTFPVTPGQKYVRLHFYPASYRQFERSKAFFSVKAADYIFLHNFSASLTADALRKQTIVKEFCLNIAENKRDLNVVFTPVFSNSDDSFAFINGIEVISMPTSLYYTDTEIHGAKLLGQSEPFPIRNDTALEMVYRINIGGIFISPAQDTGMFRTWELENDYLTVPGFSVLPLNLSREPNYTYKNPAYTAPSNVYQTARSMGNKDRALIKSYNLTWEFPVDSGFYYLVRLHFCEIQFEMNTTGDRVFLIYIAEQIAEEEADVIWWSGGKYVPVHRDYVVSMTTGEKKSNLSVALQANPYDYKSSYADGILNGVEIFKLNNSNGNLAGPNPDPTVTQTTILPPPRKSRDKSGRSATIGVVSGVVSGVVVLSVLGFFIFRKRIEVKNAGSFHRTTKWGPLSFSTTKSTKTRGSSLPSDLCRYFSLAEIKAATNNFDDLFIIGHGGFGNVYKGYIDSGTTSVAIKRLKPESSQGAQEFKTEIEMLSQLRHLHLVSLIGYCNDEPEMILVYEYMARGTLREHLYNSDNPPLSWKQRLQICIGAARGLHYLHTGAKHTIIHRDVKSTNILLDEKWEAKVSDFGLSRMGPTSMSKAHVSTVVKGSLGYLDPEYYRRQQLTEKSDVYSFGVVLCEVLCARPPLVRSVDKNQMSLAEWARGCYLNGTLDKILDEHLRGRIAPECLRKYGELAVSCMVDNGSERPSMNDVVWGLEFALQLQLSAEENTSFSEALDQEMKDSDELPFINYSGDEGKFSCSWEDTSKFNSSGVKTTSSEQSSGANQSNKIKGLSASVFSEINDPTGR